MNGPQAIQAALKSSQFLLPMYLGDLSDADLLVRPVPGANHIAWQLGHLITSEPHLVKAGLPDADFPELPAGFTEAHASTAASSDAPQKFRTKAEYLDLFGKVRAATIAAVAKLSDADLDKPTSGNMAKFAPTLGALLLMTSNHVLMSSSAPSVGANLAMLPLV